MTAKDFAMLKAGADVWNDWRSRNPGPIKMGYVSIEPRGIYLSAAMLEGVNLRGANFRDVDLRGALLNGIDLRGAELSHADLHEVDLSGADLRKANLYGANAEFANLEHADLREANFQRATIHYSLLGNAKLDGANLYGADLRGASLYGVTFHNAGLYETDFDSAHLENSDFAYAGLGRTRFTNTDLSRTMGLEKAIHHGPSSVGVDTIYKSQGKIPESFLRDCGVPDSFITQMSSLVGAEEGIQFYSCFISYSSKDEEFARRLQGRMRDAHLRVWFAPEDIQAGKKLHEQIETAIRVYDKLLVVLSKESLQSEWVMSELRKGFKAEKLSGKRKLFPVRLADFDTIRAWECFDADSGKDLAVELREYFIPDFSNWKDHDQFEAAFSRLLKDLRADERAQ